MEVHIMRRDSNGKPISEYYFLSSEFQDLDLYFRLAEARDSGKISEEDNKFLDEIIARNDRAQAIETMKYQYSIHNISEEGLSRIITTHVMALNEQIVLHNQEAKKLNELIKIIFVHSFFLDHSFWIILFLIILSC